MEREKSDLLVVSGFGDKGILEFARALGQTNKFSRVKVMKGCPWWHAKTSPRSRISAIEDQLIQMRQPVTLVGHSYGAFLALAAACRKRLMGIRGIFINGPLNPDVSVEPPQGKAIFHLFDLHYRMREDIARECMDVLRQMDDAVLKNCVTITSLDDSVVPPDAQKLPGIFPSISLSSQIRGHAMSPAKIAEVSKIILR